MAISLLTGQSSASEITTQATLSWSHTVPSGTNMLIVIAGAGNTTLDNRSVSGITFGSANLSVISGAVADDGNFEHVELWYLVNPTNGTDTITVTYIAANLQRAAGASNFSGVDVSGTPFGTAFTSSGSSVSPSVNVTGVNAGEYTLGGIASDSESGITESGTILWEQENVNTDSSFGGQYFTSSGTVSVSWTNAINTGWAVAAVAMKPSGSGGGSGSDSLTTGLSELSMNLITVSITEETS